MKSYRSCCLKGLDADGLHHSAQFPLSWALFSCSKVSSVYFGGHLRDCAKQHTGICCICQRTRPPMQTFPRQGARSSKIPGPILAGDRFALWGGYIKTQMSLVSLMKRAVAARPFPSLYEWMHAIPAYKRVCAESLFAALYSPLWSPRKVFLLPFLIQRSRDLMKTTLWLTGPLGGQMNG